MNQFLTNIQSLLSMDNITIQNEILSFILLTITSCINHASNKELRLQTIWIPALLSSNDSTSSRDSNITELSTAQGNKRNLFKNFLHDR